MTTLKSPHPADGASTLMAREDIVDFKVIVAIDFGTHGTGLGYAINDEKSQEIYIEQDWGNTRKDIDSKNKTDILLQYDGKFLKFGDDALDEFSNLSFIYHITNHIYIFYHITDI